MTTNALFGNWPSNTVRDIHEILCDATGFLFTARMKNEKQLFGDVWVIKSDKSVFNLREYLIQSGLAKKHQDIASGG